ncbi:MAG: hypothetical protein EXS16_10375 [Gemmataceae bacterium]|nr:hypothetical protein [Gemmataceae bacterium]
MTRAALLVLGVLYFFTPVRPVYAQRIHTDLKAERSAKPIQLSAEHAATWHESGYRVLLLRGNVIVSQGDSTVRSPDMVIWVDEAGQKTTRVYQAIVYADKSVTIEKSDQSESADSAYLRFATTSRIDTQIWESKIVEREISDADVYRRARSNQPAGLDLPIVRRDDAVRQASFVQPIGGDPIPAPEPTPARPTIPLTPPAPKTNEPTTKYFQIPPEPKVSPLPGGDNNAVAPPKAPFFAPTPPAPPLPPPTATGPARAMPRISIRPRYAGDLQFSTRPGEGGMTAVIFNNGISVIIVSPTSVPGGKFSDTVDLEADRVVIWTKGTPQQMFNADRSNATVDNDAYEIYLSGNVEIRSRTQKEQETLRADEVYYDVRRGVAVARRAELEIKQPKLLYPFTLTTNELIKENDKFYRAKQVAGHASGLPSDPGLVVDLSDVTIEERQRERTLFYVFPVFDKDGKRVVDTQRIFTGRNLVARLEGVPVFYFPYTKGRVEDPLGPLDNINASYNRIFGFQLNTTWDIFELLNTPRPEGSRWQLYLDYLTARGPGLGTNYEFSGKDLFGTKATYSGQVRVYGMLQDGKEDVLGGDRGTTIFFPDQFTSNNVTHPDFRGWAHGRINIQDLPNGFSVLSQFNFIRDRNFLEQYYYNTHLNDLNQDTYVRLKQQQDNWAWTLLGQISTREWMTETDWLPKADLHVIGQTFLDDWLVTNGHASVGYGRLRPTERVPFAYLPTDVRQDTVRLDWMQDISVPFDLGAIRVAPYLKGDIAYYSQDVAGDSRGRLYGGGGARWSMPLSKVYSDVSSELFNLNQIYHKVVFTGNYFNGYASSGVNNFPQMDRLNDDTTDQALRNFRPRVSAFNPGNAPFLTTSALFNPQNYAIRRLIDNRVDTLDTIDVVQLGINQRWQTKRGFPGNEHVIDWMTFNVKMSVFPHSNRDNFGNTLGIVEYDWVWNIGDRVALTSNGWIEPWSGGPRAWEFGAVTNRPDGSNFYLGYRQLDPLNSKAVVAAATYPLSGKYAFTASTVWDFGTDVRSYSAVVSRMGTDVMFNLGVNFNSTLNTFGVVFEVLPNLARKNSRAGAFMPVAANTNLDPMVNVR